MKKVREIPSFVYDPSCVLYVPFWKRDGITFISDDAFGHLCTVTDATWGIQGRSYDDVGDQIISANSTAFEVTSSTGFTLGCWVKKTAADQSMLGIGFCNNPTQSQRMELWVQQNDAGSNFVYVFSTSGGGSSSIAAISAGAWHQLVVSQASNATGNNCLVYLDGVLYASVAVLGYPTWTGGTIACAIGNNANSLPFKGTYGEAFAFNRGIIAQEIQRNYQATKWRYK